MLTTRRFRQVPLALLAAVSLAGCGEAPVQKKEPAPVAGPAVFEPHSGESHLGELRKLTSGGENAEAYFSFSGDSLIFQSTRPPYECDQIFSVSIAGGPSALVSSGLGRTTCAYFLPGDEQVIYSSTHLGGDACPPPADHSQGYVWALYPSYDVFRRDASGGETHRLTDTPGYDAEATVSPQGDRIVFTSMRDGDLDIYSMALDGGDVLRLTNELGYDGGPFFSPDGSKIVYRAYHPQDAEEAAEYRRLLDQNLIRPSQLDIWVMDADGANKKKVTDLGAASFAPFFHPSGEKIIFSSNHHDESPERREFDLFLVGVDGEGLEQVTFTPEFDGFPMFSPDGEWLVFASNRHHDAPRETNIFVTRWRD